MTDSSPPANHMRNPPATIFSLPYMWILNLPKLIAYNIALILIKSMHSECRVRMRRFRPSENRNTQKVQWANIMAHQLLEDSVPTLIEWMHLNSSIRSLSHFGGSGFGLALLLYFWSLQVGWHAVLFWFFLAHGLSSSLLHSLERILILICSCSTRRSKINVLLMMVLQRLKRQI